ncbi:MULTISPECIES: hypothetical protein [unclassified Cyanobium]|uniref:hypothetical protein n=1 Tax=unclassified Cyanobium TaxID=2627006 RepID=UPI0020CE9B4A|nr:MULTISPECIES: hypothetical protein [unclassified Cyanobium]MCP9861201.1 hypothetical protein [Cyanobium sp. Cruz-8H5]MCP9868450.1 hypothetical protein [Cyanobium sp. Cruz-8D1]
MSQNPYAWRPSDLEAIRVTLRIPVSPASIAAINEEMAALERTYPDAIPAAKAHLDAIAVLDTPPASGPGLPTPAAPVLRKRTRKGAAGPVPAELPRSKLDVIEFATELLMEEVSEEFVIPSDPSAAAFAALAHQRRHHVASLLLILPRLENWIHQPRHRGTFSGQMLRG